MKTAAVILALLLCGWTAGAHIEDESIVDPDAAGGGEDYNTLSLWEAGENADITHTGSDVIALATCQSSDGTADGTNLTFSAGWTMDANHYVVIETDPAGADRHDGTWPAGNMYTYVNNNNSITINQGSYIVYFKGIPFYMDHAGLGGGSFQHMIQVGGAGTDVHFEQCILRYSDSGDTDNHGLTMLHFGAETLWSNCLIYDFAGTGHEGLFVSTGNVRVSNCTFHNCDRGVQKTTDANCALYLYNNIGQGSPDANIFDLTGTATWEGTEDYNIEDDGNDIAGGNSINSTEVLFENEGADEFAIGAGDTSGAKTGGNNLSGDTPPVTDDIIGVTRTVPYSMGAFEFVAAVGGLGQFIIIGN